ncbi:MAG: SusC/RagA family TonB-linked outer membrane protein [Gemmatimonadaceae bacterium]
MRVLCRCAVVLLGAVALPRVALAQDTGSLEGRVTEAGAVPVPDALITIVGTNRGARTTEDGQYRIASLRPGEVMVRVTRLGYAAVARPATIAAGQTARLDFELTAAAVTIDEVVVTATGESQRRRESGNTVNTVIPTPERLSTSTTVAQLLEAQAPGVYINSPGGTTGSASRIRIRGANSLSLTNEPLLIIDGIRVSNEITQSNNLGGGIGVGGQGSSRFNDINPDDIASIEILKGPAAAALYGTAAASGVIQIRTKRGRPGGVRWTTYVEGGTQEDVTDYPANFSQIGTRVSNGERVTGCTLDAQVRSICTPKADSLARWNPLEQASPFVTGTRTSLGLSVAGGGEAANYFVSGDLDRDWGILEPNKFKRVGLRANFNGQLGSDLGIQVATNFVSSRLEFPQNDNNILGVLGGALLGSAFDNPTSRGWLSGQTPGEVFALDVREDVERFLGSIGANWQAMSWLTIVGTTGVDYFTRRNKSTVPPNRVFFGSLPEGQRTANITDVWNYTANGSASANFSLTPEVTSTTTLGVQFTQEMVQGNRAFGAKLLAGTGSLQGTAARFGVGEANTDNKTLGALLQQQVGWRDRLFATAAVRTDNNSAFGENFGWIAYPAFSLSYVISEEPFFPQTDILSSLRLRAAYGQSGQRPNFRDAITFFNTQTITAGGTDFAGVTVGGTGNPDLRPELSREYEVGFESALLNDRIGLEFTYYDKKTKDLLVQRPLPPSAGETQVQFANLGTSTNTGFEGRINARVFEIGKAHFDITAIGSTNRNRLVTLGNLPSGDPIPDIVFGPQRHVAGFPLGGYWDEGYTFQDLNNDGIITRVNCPGQPTVAGGPACEFTRSSGLVYLGNPLPTREWSLSPRFGFSSWLEISALFDHKGGYKLFNNTGRFRCNFGNCQAAYDPSAPLFEQARHLGQGFFQTDAGFVEDATFTKLREVSITLTAPRDLAARFRAEGVRLTIAGRNLATWTEYTGFDPEVNSQPLNLFSTSDFLTIPPLRMFTTRLTVQF